MCWIAYKKRANMNLQKRCYKSCGCSKVENKNFAYQLEKNKSAASKS